jgi:hypothetical protein
MIDPIQLGSTAATHWTWHQAAPPGYDPVGRITPISLKCARPNSPEVLRLDRKCGGGAELDVGSVGAHGGG